MKNKVNVLLLLIATVVFSSCSPTQLLVSTFENDAVGSQPNKTLPGDPQGDQIQYEDVIAGRLRVQNSTIAGQKALHFTQSALSGTVSGHRVWLSFKGASTSYSRNISFEWSAQQQETRSAEEYVLADVSDGSGKVMIRLYFYGDGRVKRINAIATDAGTIIGNLNPLHQHSVTVEVNLSAKTYRLYLLDKVNRTAISQGNLPFLSYGTPLTYANPMNPAVAFRLDDYVNNRRKYILEDVRITQSTSF